VKPLLQVTNTEEKLNKKENELRQVTEHLTVLRGEHDSLTAEHQQLTSDKVLLAQQLRAEQDLCAETEEVLCSVCALLCRSQHLVFIPPYSTNGWVGYLVYCAFVCLYSYGFLSGSKR